MDGHLEAVAAGLVTVRAEPDGLWVTLPVLIGDADAVRLRVTKAEDGYTVTDDGLAAREAWMHGFEGDFNDVAATAAAGLGLKVLDGAILVDGLQAEQLAAGLIWVADTSRRAYEAAARGLS